MEAILWLGRQGDFNDRKIIKKNGKSVFIYSHSLLMMDFYCPQQCNDIFRQVRKRMFFHNGTNVTSGGIIVLIWITGRN